MKKILLLMAFVMPVLLGACSSDDDNDTTNVLAGTTWEETEETGSVVNAIWTLTFEEATFRLVFSADDNGDGIFERKESVEGTYTIDGQNVSLKADKLNISGTINGNTLHFPETDETDEFTYHRK